MKHFHIFFVFLFTGDFHTVGAELGHPHNTPDAHGHSSKIHDKDFIANEEHMKTHHQQDFGEEYDVTKFSTEEWEFRFFYTHDTNNDTMLDGLELLQAIIHQFTEEELINLVKEEQPYGTGLDRYETLARMVDDVLHEDDLDNNGYLTYEEFSVQRRREANATAHSSKS